MKISSPYLFKLIRSITLFLAVFCLVITSRLLASVANNLKFNHLTVDDGLSNSQVNCMLQGKRGFIWIGTQDGLNRFDGHSFVVFRKQQNNPNSISGNGVWALCEDNKGNLWIGTYGQGLNKLNTVTGKFNHYKNVRGDPDSLCDNRVIALFEDSQERIWVGTDQGGFCWLDPTETVFHRPDERRIKEKDLGSRIFCFFEDDGGNIWIGSNSGVVKYQPETGIFSDILGLPKEVPFFRNRAVYEVFRDKNGRIWLGLKDGVLEFNPEIKKSHWYPFDPHYNTEFKVDFCVDSSGILWTVRGSGGLNRVDPENQNLIHYPMSPYDPYGLTTDELNCLAIDESGLLWIGTTDGIFQLNERCSAITHYFQRTRDQSMLSVNRVAAIFKDSDGFLWFGTQEGLDRFDRRSNKFIPLQERVQHSLNQSRVWALEEDSRKRLWIGTIGEGVYVLDLKKEKLTNFRNKSEEPDSISHDAVTEIFRDRRARIWVGTDGGGLNLLEEGNEKFIRFQHDAKNPSSLGSDIVMDITQDQKDHYWVATWGGGLNQFDGQTDRFTHFQHDAEDPNSLSFDIVLCVMEDRKGNIWAGTYGGGLNKLNPDTGSFTRYAVKDGLPNNNVLGILEDNQGILWISTYSGLTRFDPDSQDFITFNQQDGFQSREFNINAYYMAQDGELFFGGKKGVSAFFPEALEKRTYSPPLRFTSIEIFGKDTQKDYFLSDKTKIKISYKDSFRLSFSSLDYYNPSKNKYAYQLGQHPDDWNELGNNNSLTLANLRAGSYRLKVKGTNSDGIENQNEASLLIHVSPPFWGTWWFRAVIVLIGAGFLINWHRNRMQRLARRLKTEAQVERLCLKYKISEREVEIIKLLLRGYNRSKVADKLFISELTVRNHIYSIYKKLGIKNRAQLLEIFRHMDR